MRHRGRLIFNAIFVTAFLAILAPFIRAGTDDGVLGQLDSISLLPADDKTGSGERLVIAGEDASRQILVTGHYSSGTQQDLTRGVAYEVAPEGIVAIDESGFVSPITEGVATVMAIATGDVAATVEIEVSHLENELPINFPNQVVPIFTKYGCNGGGCHGKSSGQNGFRLSLLGFEPAEDYEFLLKEGRGRRLFPAAPDRSLLVQKATAQVPHGGGQRLKPGSPPYRVLRRWIAQGMPYGADDERRVVGIDVFPEIRTLRPHATQQLAVVARYSDGSREDVTRMTQLESNDAEMASVDENGLLTVADQTGSVAVMARYQGQVDVFRAILPLGVDVENLPTSRNFVDELVFKQLKRLGLPPSQTCTDEEFLRRTSITLAGRLPTLEESSSFIEDDSQDKRDEVIERLLSSTDYADHFANKWSAILRNKRKKNDDKNATFAFHRWIRDSLHHNKPYDQFVSEIVTASGDVTTHPAVAWYRELKDSSSLVEDTAQLFLGMRIQCAKCHHHPFETWSQKDYHSFSAFYSRVGKKSSNDPGYRRVFHRYGQANATNPKTGETVVPTGLSGEPLTIAPEDDPREHLADWMVDPQNPFFAKAIVNRYWKHVFGRGLVDPEDDMRITNPPTNPELLEALAADFVENGYDLKRLLRTICSSQVFQLSAEPNVYNQKDKQNFSRFYPRRLNAETLLDAIDQVTGIKTQFSGVPAGTRAMQLPDNGFDSYFLTVFGRPESNSACECERSSDANLAQSLHLLNSADIQNKITGDNGRAAQLCKDDQCSDDQRIEQLYLLAFSRGPREEELDVARSYLASKDNQREAYEDIVWALINTKEFLFNH